MRFGYFSGAMTGDGGKAPKAGNESGLGTSTGRESTSSDQASTVADRTATQRAAAVVVSQTRTRVNAAAEVAKLRSSDILALQQQLAACDALIAMKTKKRNMSGIRQNAVDLLDAEIQALNVQRVSLVAQIAAVQAQIDKDAAAAIAKAAYTAHLLATSHGSSSGGTSLGNSSGAPVTFGTGSTTPATSGGPAAGTNPNSDPYVTPLPPPGMQSTGGGGSASLSAAQQAQNDADAAAKAAWLANQQALAAQQAAQAAADALAAKQAQAEADAQAAIDAAKSAADAKAAQDELDRIKRESIVPASSPAPLLIGVGLLLKFFVFS